LLHCSHPARHPSSPSIIPPFPLFLPLPAAHTNIPRRIPKRARRRRTRRSSRTSLRRSRSASCRILRTCVFFPSYLRQ
jgi:hypothetical protein